MFKNPSNESWRGMGVLGAEMLSMVILNMNGRRRDELACSTGSTRKKHTLTSKKEAADEA